MPPSTARRRCEVGTTRRSAARGGRMCRLVCWRRLGAGPRRGGLCGARADIRPQPDRGSSAGWRSSLVISDSTHRRYGESRYGLHVLDTDRVPRPVGADAAVRLPLRRRLDDVLHDRDDSRLDLQRHGLRPGQQVPLCREHPLDEQGVSGWPSPRDRQHGGDRGSRRHHRRYLSHDRRRQQRGVRRLEQPLGDRSGRR